MSEGAEWVVCTLAGNDWLTRNHDYDIDDDDGWTWTQDGQSAWLFSTFEAAEHVAASQYTQNDPPWRTMLKVTAPPAAPKPEPFAHLSGEGARELLREIDAILRRAEERGELGDELRKALDAAKMGFA